MDFADDVFKFSQRECARRATGLEKLAINLHNSELFKMVSTSTPRSRIYVATRDFTAFQRTPTRQQMSFAIILEKHVLLLNLYILPGVEVLAILKCSISISCGFLPPGRSFACCRLSSSTESARLSFCFKTQSIVRVGDSVSL